MSENDKFWCALSRLTKVSSAFVNDCLAVFGSIEKVWNADFNDLAEVPGMTPARINAYLVEKKNIDPDESLKYIKNRGIQFITPESENYPYMLRYINNPPIGLFVKGDLSLCNLNRTLAVVGSRKASEYAKNALKIVLSGLANTDICIVSGLANGIDTAAHEFALNNNLKTVAVIGGGFDKLYPKSNVKLFERIIDGNGAVISEYWPDTDALNWHFPVRNRIVSGMSKGVLVAEAALKSGAMITANLALEQGKDLMCIPGAITNPNTGGIYKLLKTGACIVTETSDILNELGWEITSKPVKKAQKDLELSDNERIIYDLVSKDALTTDEIVFKSGLSIDEVLVTTVRLEIAGIIKQIDGEKFIGCV